MKGLTKRQQEIVQYVSEFIKTHRYSPSYREIMQHFGYNSLGTVYKHLQVLKRKGLLNAEKQCSRSLMLVAEQELNHKALTEIQLPFIGHISGGSPIETFPQSRMVSVPESLVHSPDKTYVLRVMGDNLSEELIVDGDLLLVEARQEANPGETVVAWVHQHETVIKRYYPEGHYVRLMGNSHHQQPIIIRQEELQIQGILVGLLRFFG